MWKISIYCNALVLLLFWVLAQVFITPIENLLVRYAETKLELPILTDFAIQMSTPSLAIPIIWAILSFIIGRHISGQSGGDCHAWVSLHTSITLCLGLMMLIFFSLAAILPLLKIGAML